MGRIAAPYGIKGWVKVQPFTDRRDGLCAYRTWWLARGDEWREMEVLECAVHGASVIARLAGCDVREAAAKFRGADVGVPRASLPAAGEDEYYWSDLIGLEVVTLSGELLGKVSGLQSNGVHDLMQVAGEPQAAGTERLVPFVAHVVREVSLAEGRIVVDWGVDW